MAQPGSVTVAVAWAAGRADMAQRAKIWRDPHAAFPHCITAAGAQELRAERNGCNGHHPSRMRPGGAHHGGVGEGDEGLARCDSAHPRDHVCEGDVESDARGVTRGAARREASIRGAKFRSVRGGAPAAVIVDSACVSASADSSRWSEGCQNQFSKMP